MAENTSQCGGRMCGRLEERGRRFGDVGSLENSVVTLRRMRSLVC
jgi:hypothetical protein